MIVIFNGPPASGKDFGASFFKNRGFEHVTFKDQLFKETFKLFDVNEKWFMEGYEDRETKESPSCYLSGLSRREAMIYTSEEYIKPRFGKSFFGDAVANIIDLDKDYTISDGGFTEELYPIINKVGHKNIILVQLVRDECSYESDSRKYFNGKPLKTYVIGAKSKMPQEHILEEEFPIFTYRIYNNGTKEEFNEILETIYNDLKHMKEKEL